MSEHFKAENALGLFRSVVICGEQWTDFCEDAYRGAHEEISTLRADLAAAERERDAIRVLMSMYNLGGWTDAVAPMQRALAAEARVAALEAVAEDDAAVERAALAMWRDPSVEFDSCSDYVKRQYYKRIAAAIRAALRAAVTP